MTPDVQTPVDADRESMARLFSTSLNLPLERTLVRKDRLPLEDMRCAYVDGRVVATAGEFLFDQWFGGQPVPCSGIWGVATEPEHRGAGLATACVTDLLDGARRRGDPLSALFPAVLEPYRRLGYELAGTHNEHRVALDALPSVTRDDLPEVALIDLDRDLAGIRACYREWVRHHNGPVEPRDDDHWVGRIVHRPWDDTFRAIVVRDGERVTGFVAFTRTPEPAAHLDVAFGMACEPLVATDVRALRALIAYLRGHRGVGRWLGWVGPPNDPLSLWVGVQAVELARRYRWMLRLLDVPAAFEGRGYPAIDASVTFQVDDPLYPDNAGPWRLTVERGEPRVEPVDHHDRRPIAIGVLSSLFSGYLHPADAARFGYLDADDPAVETFGAVFAGPDPWCPFFF
ncbi:MAG: GNAT family N-acetyltransferase [Actinomycetota bacterium]